MLPLLSRLGPDSCCGACSPFSLTLAVPPPLLCAGRKAQAGLSGDLSCIGKFSDGARCICTEDLVMARLLTTLADNTYGNPALLLQNLLGYASEDYNDLLSALSESGCSYVDVLAAYLHNMRVMAEDASADPSAASEAVQRTINEKYREVLGEMVRTTIQSGSSGASHAMQAPAANPPPAPAPLEILDLQCAMEQANHLHLLQSLCGSPLPTTISSQEAQEASLLNHLLSSHPLLLQHLLAEQQKLPLQPGCSAAGSAPSELSSLDAALAAGYFSNTTAACPSPGLLHIPQDLYGNPMPPPDFSSAALLRHLIGSGAGMIQPAHAAAWAPAPQQCYNPQMDSQAMYAQVQQMQQVLAYNAWGL